MATMNVSLPAPMKDWVEEQLADGRFSNTSDYVRHLIRKDQERVAALSAVQAAVSDGIVSGEPQPFDFKAFKQRMRKTHGEA
ncbi:type II toxin-antitoxin system ParD family antitoxin [Roseibium sediminis]|uniref:type II toxin-antitoxin system ParD family antitoxin n=1 Tax=Roseibium sediminis TaxID=1775174 RepID=UPI00123D37C8|nr:type II toxin-antitoxin system ParD family antitoxin [Roseibium sediminis]